MTEKVVSGGGVAGGVACGEGRSCPAWLGSILQGALCHLFQRLALEVDKTTANLAYQVHCLISCTYCVLQILVALSSKTF